MAVSGRKDLIVVSPIGWMSHWSSVYVGILKKYVLTPAKGMPLHQDRWTCQGEGKQAESKNYLLPSPSMYTATRWCDPDLGWFCQPEMIQIWGWSFHLNHLSICTFKKMSSQVCSDAWVLVPDYFEVHIQVNSLGDRVLVVESLIHARFALPMRK